MTRSSANLNHTNFARFRWPKFGLLRDADHEAVHRGRRIRRIAANLRITRVRNSENGPLVMTKPCPQAIMAAETNSATSLNSQGRVVNV